MGISRQASPAENMWDKLLWVFAVLRVTSTYAQHYDDYRRRPSDMSQRRIINGSNAVLGQFPHQALLIVEDRYICGGSLIAEKIVLTGAHCIRWRDKYTVRLGGVHMMQHEPTAWIHISYWSAVHHSYDPETLNNDVALVFLAEAPPMSRYIKPVTLPSALDVEDSFVGRRGLVSGFGKTDFYEPPAEILQWTKAQVIDNDECKPHYKPGYIIESSLCAHDIPTSTIYRGDRGSALVLETGDTYKQIGIVSFGPWDGNPLTPAVYSRVTSYLEWIKTAPEDRK